MDTIKFEFDSRSEPKAETPFEGTRFEFASDLQPERLAHVYPALRQRVLVLHKALLRIGKSKEVLTLDGETTLYNLIRELESEAEKCRR